MKNQEPTPFRITHQGAPVPNVAWYRYKSDQCLVISLDMGSKYTDFAASAGSKVFIEADANSLFVDDSKSRDEYTVVEFDLPPGDWQLCVGARSGRYELTFTYIKQEPSE